MAFTCDVNDLLANSKCMQESCMGKTTRDAIDIYLRVANLAASGGADYSTDLNALLQAAKEFQVLYDNQRDAIELWIDLQNAIDNGAAVSSDINTLRNAARCYECLGKESQKNLLTFLKCAINTLGKPD